MVPSSDAPQWCGVCSCQVSGPDRQSHIGHHILQKLRGMEKNQSSVAVSSEEVAGSVCFYFNFLASAPRSSHCIGINSISMWILWSVELEQCLPSPHPEWKGYLNMFTSIQLQDQCSFKNVRQEAINQCPHPVPTVCRSALKVQHMPSPSRMTSLLGKDHVCK